MKVDLTPEQLAAHDAATLRGGIEGSIVGAAIGFPLSYLMYKKVPIYRAMPASLKALGVIVCIAPAFAIQAERRGIEYDRSQWTDAGIRLLDQQEVKLEEHWESLTVKQKIIDWANRHEYSVILGGWVASIGLAGTIISRDKLQSTSQKVVQARMWAQALTIGLILGAAAFKARQSNTQPKVVDHSWRDVLEQQERARMEDEARLKQVPSSEARRAAQAL
ncbi:hypothetical protein CPB85DRAFT_1433152 [Mucidula mucida]|nr:hypothetical protein CPB85DRAFT_1433152 [Mucidula mucida]